MEFLRTKLATFANLARQRKQRDFVLPVQIIQETFPELHIDQADPRVSPYAALLDNNILVEERIDVRGRSIGFEFADLGSYLLSFGLEDEWQQLTDSKTQQERISEWLREAHGFPPLLDALLAWIDRLADDPRSPTLHLLLSAALCRHFIQDRRRFRSGASGGTPSSCSG